MRNLGAYAIVHLLAGAGRYVDANGVDVAISAGDVLIIFPDLPHTYGPGVGQTWSELYFIFDGAVFDLWRQSAVINPAKPVHRAVPLDYWFDRWKSVVDPNLQPLQSLCALQKTLADLLAAETTPETSSQQDAWLNRAKKKLLAISSTDRPDWDLTSAGMGMTYAGFRKRFAKLAGITPGAFLESRRLELATRLLARPGLGLKQIARQLGFCDEFHFSRRFKRRTGLSPRDYRRIRF
jgi:AraC-like DNA-binding protein